MWTRSQSPALYSLKISRSVDSISIHQLLIEINIFKSRFFYPLLEVGRATVAAFGVFIEQEIVAGLLESCGHFAAVAGLHAVIGGGNMKENFWIVDAGFDVLIGRILLNHFRHFGVFGIAIFTNPARAGRKFGVSQ